MVTPRATAHSAAKPAARPFSHAVSTAAAAAAAVKQEPTEEAAAGAAHEHDELMGGDDWGMGADEGAAAMELEEGGPEAAGPTAAVKEEPAAAAEQQEQQERTPAGHGAAAAAAEGAPAGGTGAGAAGKTPWKTPAPVFADPKTPGTAAPASGWQLLYEGGGEEAGGADTPGPAAEQEWKDDGSLPVDGEGVLPFYLIDAHEEPAQPGAVFLFGKVGAGP